MNKKICFFSGNISRNGGTERVSTLIANELNRRGYNIVFLSYEDGKNSYYKLDDNIKLYTLLERKYNNYFLRKIMPYIRLFKFIKKEKVDIIIDIDVILSLYTIPVKLVCKIKNISWEHFNYYSQNVKNRVKARKLASKFSDLIVTLNERDLNNYKNNLKNIKRIEFIYNPATVKRENVTDLNNNIAIAVGRFTFQKGFDSLLEIWKKIEEKNSLWKLLIIGDGEEKEKLLNLINEYKLNNVSILPFQNDIEKIYENSSLYLMTSRYEGFPMVLLEAQKKGLPIIAFDCETGPSEIVIDNRNGFLIEVDNKDLFVKKALSLMNDEKKKENFSKNAIVDSGRFDVKKIVDKWENVLNSL